MDVFFGGEGRHTVYRNGDINGIFWLNGIFFWDVLRMIFMTYWVYKNTLWLFNIAMENCPFIDDFPINTSIFEGFAMAMLNNQRVTVYKPTNITAEPHPVVNLDQLVKTNI